MSLARKIQKIAKGLILTTIATASLLIGTEQCNKVQYRDTLDCLERNRPSCVYLENKINSFWEDFSKEKNVFSELAEFMYGSRDKGMAYLYYYDSHCK